MEVIDLELPGLKLIRPKVFGDSRGFFVETYSRERYVQAGIDVVWAQDNNSRSVKDTLRGLHYQSSPGQAKLLRCSAGRIWDVAVDIRQDSPTFGKWYAAELDAEKHEQLFIPVGFAHGFCVLSDIADVQYKCSAPYDAKTERGLAWDDPEIAVKWPVASPLLSARDQSNESFAALRKRLGR